MASKKTPEPALIAHKNQRLTMAERRSLNNALTSVWTYTNGLIVHVPANLDTLCELTIRLAGVDEAALEALPIEQQTEALIRLANALVKGLAGEASGA